MSPPVILCCRESMDPRRCCRSLSLSSVRPRFQLVRITLVLILASFAPFLNVSLHLENEIDETVKQENTRLARKHRDDVQALCYASTAPEPLGSTSQFLLPLKTGVKTHEQVMTTLKALSLHCKLMLLHRACKLLKHVSCVVLSFRLFVSQPTNTKHMSFHLLLINFLPLSFTN
uniref:Uncharacterized protein n=1 Tax=Cyclopterus lumpus TaxID=8103 RepID=A0A8C2XV82_CYCLU